MCNGRATRRASATIAATLLLAGGVASEASASITLGDVDVMPTLSEDGTIFQLESPGDTYTVPSPGVITWWSHLPRPQNPARLKLKIGRPIGDPGAGMIMVVGESVFKSTVPGGVNGFTDVSIPVQPGDVLGSVRSGQGAQLRALSGSEGNYRIESHGGDMAPGTTAQYSPSYGFQVAIAAGLEPDCDGDGLGDESQDPSTLICLVSAPDTILTRYPPDRSRRRLATFEFTSNNFDASFECRIDGEPFAPCVSPFAEKVRRGKHSFEVRASANGLSDGSPAADKWKVRKRRK